MRTSERWLARSSEGGRDGARMGSESDRTTHGETGTATVPSSYSPLSLEPELMRRLGYQTIDMLVDRITGPPGAVVRSATPGELRDRLSMPPPEGPTGYDEILTGLERDVLPYVARISHP